MFSNWLSAIRPGEGRNVVGAFLTLLGTLIAHEMMETARDALFLANLPPERLPWVYLGIAGVAFAIVRLSQASSRDPRRILMATIAISAVITGGFYALLQSGATWVFYGLYIWSGVLATLVTLRFWMALGNLFTASQAKRLYGPIGVGSVLGAISGSLVSVAVTSQVSPEYLVPGAAGVLLITSLVPMGLLTDGRKQSHSFADDSTRSLVGDLKLVFSDQHGKATALLVVVSAVALTLADFIFKSVVAAEISSDSLGWFFAVFYTGVNFTSLLMQTIAVSWLLRRLGVSRALVILPVMLFLGSAGVIAGGALIAALALKGADGTLRHSIHRTATEMLYVPLSSDVRSRLKELIDVVGQRGGQALGAIVILGVSAASWGIYFLAVSVMVLSITWITITRRLQNTYLQLFRDTLREGMTETRIAFPELDLASLESLVAALNSSRDDEVIAAMDLLSEKRRASLIPALILYHPSETVVAHALDIFARSGRQDFVPIADRLTEEAEGKIRSLALLARTSVAPDEDVLRSQLNGSCPFTHAAAAVGLIANDFMSENERHQTLDAIFDDGKVETKLALGRGVELMPSEHFEDVLIHLALSVHDEIQLQAVKAMIHIPSQSFMPVLIPLLAVRRIRPAARKAILAIGEPALEDLERALYEPAVDFGVRLHIPRTVHRFDSARAAEVLVHCLEDSRDNRITYKALRALNRLSLDNPRIKLNTESLDQLATDHLRRAYTFLAWQESLLAGAAEDPSRGTEGYELLVTLLEHLHESTVERLFRLLGLLYADEDFRHIHSGLSSTRPEVRSSSRELLEHRLPNHFAESVLNLVDEIDSEDKLEIGNPWVPDELLDYEGTLQAILDTEASKSSALQALAVHHIGELGLTRFKEDLELIEPSDEAYSTLIDRARRLLTAEDSGRMANA